MTDIQDSRPYPVALKDRVRSLDAMRGLAVLGILAVNVVAFAFPFGVYMDAELAPQAPGAVGTYWVWVSDTFFHSKFITLFTMLFGASVFMVGGERKDPVRGPLIRRRLLWLIGIALIHGLLIWWGDVLLLYAVTGLLVMLCRSMSGRKLIWIGLGVTILLALLAALGALAMNFAPPEIQASIAEQKASMGGTPETIAASIANYRSGWSGMLHENFAAWVQLQVASTFYIIPTLGLMLLGMGLFKTGFMAGRAPTGLYLLLIVLGGGVLAATGWYGWQEAFAAEGQAPMNGLVEALNAFAFVITLAYMSVMILLATRGPKLIAAVFEPVGRMAFTNYLTQSLIMSTIFTQPWGPRLMGQVGWEALPLLVAGVWAAQLVWSPLWLSVFRMGPLEWVWRCLTYGRLVPLLKGR
ncbi:MAG: DUF418 domain-containing protein [Caulobacterales bacterium]|nr:DUF418 domain-containing protein [Caulobacterales bacterium]